MPVYVREGLGAAQKVVTPTTTTTTAVKSALGPTTLVKPTTTQLTPIAPPISLPPPKPAPVPLTPQKVTAFAPTAAPKAAPAPAPAPTPTAPKDDGTRAQEFTKETAVTSDRDPTKQPGYEPPPREDPGSHGETETSDPVPEVVETDVVVSDVERQSQFINVPPEYTAYDYDGEQEIMAEGAFPRSQAPAKQSSSLVPALLTAGGAFAVYWLFLRKTP